MPSKRYKKALEVVDAKKTYPLKAAGTASGSKTPNKDKVGKVTKKQVMDIVKLKTKDLNAMSEEAAFRIVAGTARSMGIEVIV